MLSLQLYPLITSYFFGPNIFFSILSQIPSVYLPPLISETTFHTHIEPRSKLGFYIPIFFFSTVDEKTEGSRPHFSKHYQNSISLKFLSELNFYLLLSFPNS
jgi:hypothetical protein